MANKSTESVKLFKETNVSISTESIAPYSIWLNKNEFVPTDAALGEVSTLKSVNNTQIDAEQSFQSDPQTLIVFEAFTIIEIVMTALELIISSTAAIKMPRWRKNYRNQMLMQLSAVRFVKRVISCVEFYCTTSNVADNINVTLFCLQMYVDFVIVILVFFFIKHMYESLIVVLIKISHIHLYKVLTCAWLLPVPVTVIWTVIIVTNILDKWLVYLLICCIFRWPLILLGSILYATLVYKILNDGIRKFARSLAVITFLLCLVINLYLFSKDVIWLWCVNSFSTILISYLLGFLLNFLILCLYVALIFLNYKSKTKSCNYLPSQSMCTINYITS